MTYVCAGVRQSIDLLAIGGSPLLDRKNDHNSDKFIKKIILAKD